MIVKVGDIDAEETNTQGLVILPTENRWVVAMLPDGMIVGLWDRQESARLHAHMCGTLAGNWCHSSEALDVSGSRDLMRRLANTAADRVKRVVALMEVIP